MAEAGSGGDGPCIEGPEGQSCLGSSGSIARVNLGSGAVPRVVRGLPSLAGTGPSGFSATGPHNVTAIDGGEYDVAVSLGGTPAV